MIIIVLILWEGLLVIGLMKMHLGGIGTLHYKGVHRIMFGCSKWLHYDALLAQLGLVNATYHISFFFFFQLPLNKNK